MLLCSKGVIFSKRSEIYIILSRCKFLWNIFFFFWCPLFFYLLSNGCRGIRRREGLQSGGGGVWYLKDGSIRRSRISLIISSTLMSSSSNPPPSPTSNSADNFARRQPRQLPATFQDTATITEIVAATDARFSALISWVVYCIDVFFSHRLWPWGRTAVVTTTFWPIL